jgi:hypothetical protein
MSTGFNESFGERQAKPTSATRNYENSAIELELWKAETLGFGFCGC